MSSYAVAVLSAFGHVWTRHLDTDSVLGLNHGTN